MKKVISILFALASVTVLFIGCTKEVNNQQLFTEGTHTVTFAVDQAETRTQVVLGDNSASYIWNDTDAQYLHVFENDVKATSVSLSLENNGAVGTITATFPNSTATSFVYKAYYFGEETNTHNFKVLDTQNPKANSFDPKSDVLVAKEISSDAAQNSLKLRFGRVAVITKMTLKGMVPGEVVSKVTLTGSAALAGSYALASTDDQGNPVAAHWNAGSKKLVFEEFENAVVDENGEFPIFFVSIPFEGTISIAATTNQNQYDRSDIATSLKFEVGTMARFGVKLNDYGTPISEGVDYTLVSSQSDLELGAEYLIVGGGTRAMSVQTANNRATVAVTPVDNVITIDNTIAANIFKLEAAGNYYFITDVTPDAETVNLHLYAPTASTTSGNNYLQSVAAQVDASVWTITIDNGVASIVCFDTSKKGVMCLNGDIISCYKELGSYKTLALYKKDLRTKLDAPESVSAAISESDDNVIDVTFSSVSGAASYVIVATSTTGNVITKTGILSSPASISVTDGLAYNTEYTISVYAVPTNTTDYRNSDATVAPNSVVTGGAPEGYELVTSLSDVTTGRYVLAAKIGDDYIGMPSTLGTSPFAGSKVTESSGFVSVSDAEDYVLTIIKDGSSYTIKGSTSTLGYGSSGTSFNLTPTGDKALWTISDGTHGTFRIANVGTNTRAVVYRTGNYNVFGAYATSSINGTEYYDVELFKYNGTVVIKTDPSITVTPTSPIALEVNGTQTLTVVTNSDGDISYVSSDDDVVTVDEDGLITGVSAGSATITISTAETDSFNAGSVDVTVKVTAGSSSVAQVLSKGAGTYKINNLLVYSVVGNQAIVGDNTGRMVLYKSGHGLEVGDIISIASASVAERNGILQIQDGTFTKNSSGNTVNHGTATDLNDATVASTTQSAFSATGYHAATFVSMSGVQSGRNITGSNATLYLSTADATLDGKGVNVTGYIYYYNTSHTNYNFQLVTIEENNTIPTISVSPASLSWAAAETDYKTLAVTLNGSASSGDYSYSITDGTAADWNITDNETGTITVSPKAANTSTDFAKSVTLRIAHKDAATTVYQDVICSQAKASSGEIKTYQHIFNAKPSTGSNIELSGVNWNISATNLGSYNSGNYAGVQIGTKSASGSITLTSPSSWSYQNASSIKEIRVWMNAGTDVPTASVTIGGVTAVSDGTIVQKNSSASSYTDATKVTYTPGSNGTSGVVVINVATTSKAGYICAIEIDCE